MHGEFSRLTPLLFATQDRRTQRVSMAQLTFIGLGRHLSQLPAAPSFASKSRASSASLLFGAMMVHSVRRAAATCL